MKRAVVGAPLLLVVLSAAVPAGGQMSSPTLEAQRSAIARLEPLVGEWKGEGWVRMGPGEPQPFAIEERVQRKLDGVALLVEGHGTTKGPDGETVTGHLALAVVTWDPESQGYLFQTHTGLGHHTDAELELLDDGRIRWGFTAHQREVRYTMELSGDTWHETGEVSMDGGESWMQFHDMTLKRVRAGE